MNYYDMCLLRWNNIYGKFYFINSKLFKYERLDIIINKLYIC